MPSPKAFGQNFFIFDYPRLNSFLNFAKDISISRCQGVALLILLTEHIRYEAYLDLLRANLVLTQWDFCPSLPASIHFFSLFCPNNYGALSQAILYKKTYCWVVVGSGLLQTVKYLVRSINIAALPNSKGLYATWFVLILVNYSQAARDMQS